MKDEIIKVEYVGHFLRVGFRCGIVIGYLEIIDRPVIIIIGERPKDSEGARRTPFLRSRRRRFAIAQVVTFASAARTLQSAKGIPTWTEAKGGAHGNRSIDHRMTGIERIEA